MVSFCLWVTMLVVVVALTACGSTGASVSDKEAAQDILLEVSELPSGSSAIKKANVSEKCGPTTYFRNYATAVAAPPGFSLPTAELLQDVGVFKSDGEARRAFAAITSTKARGCVASQMQQQSLQLVGQRGQLSTETVPRTLPGETTRSMRLQLSFGFGWLEVERTAILHGRALTALTFISQSQPLKQAYWKSISVNAAGSLDDTVSSIEG